VLQATVTGIPVSFTEHRPAEQHEPCDYLSRIGTEGRTLQGYYNIFGTVEEVEVSAESTILLSDPALNLDSDALFLDWWRQVQALFQPTLPH
jgi:hypothetical protein